jgi:hypothetical protein
MDKTCCSCGLAYPATKEHFFGQSRNMDGLRAECKNCFRRRYMKIKYPNGRIRMSNKERNARCWAQRKNNPTMRIAHVCRTRVRLALKGSNKADSTFNLIGCTPNELKQHLENGFREGMSWDNYGKWHIDHIRPCASFDLSKPEQQTQCFHYSNLQPLWSGENLRKSDR